MLLEESDVDRLIKTISEKVIAAIRPHDNAIEKSISHKEAADFLNISRNTLTERINSGRWPVSIVHMNGSKREYYKSELKALLDKKRK